MNGWGASSINVTISIVSPTERKISVDEAWLKYATSEQRRSILNIVRQAKLDEIAEAQRAIRDVYGVDFFPDDGYW